MRTACIRLNAMLILAMIRPSTEAMASGKSGESNRKHQEAQHKSHAYLRIKAIGHGGRHQHHAKEQQIAQVPASAAG